MQDTTPDATPAQRKAWLAAEARRLGFTRVGFASCDPFTETAPQRGQWLAEGGADLLPYLAEPGWEDPRSVLPSARTALVGFFPYARPDAIPGGEPGSPKASRYLWGPDYHMVLKGRLSRLLTAAQARWPGLEGRVCVDTAWIQERPLAVRAGLGWQGRHTLLIAGKDGSWGFLGILLLDLELPLDPPFPGHRCGTCTACLEACPTGAISPFRVDPNRCLTTYNLETEADLPSKVELAIQQTEWVAGCDLCQEVCPWNRRPLWGDPDLWGGASALHTLPLEAASLGGAQYRKHIRRTAFRRVRHRHWLRMIDLVRMGRGLPPLAAPEGP